MTTVEKLNEYLKNEYEDTKQFIKEYPDLDIVMIVQKACSRCLGAVMFAQHIGVKYEECGYCDTIKEKLYALLDETWEKMENDER